MKDILAAVDLSAISPRVVEEATRLAAAFGARAWIVHVAAPDPDFVGYEAGPSVVRQQVARHLREDHRKVQALAEEARGRGIEVTALLVQGPTVLTLLDEASKLAVDLIVLGSHGRGAVLRALLGSTSEGVLRKAEVPVLIVPARAAEA